jgi:sigma-B regulation protein RsbU (phosphoserine phosphatase)
MITFICLIPAWEFVIADVSGHGIGPALLMAEARSCLRFLSRASSDPAEILSRANRDLAEDLGGEQYMTILLAHLDPIRRRLIHCSAGHPPALVLGPDGTIKAELRRTGPPLGQRAEFPYTCGADLALEPGDVVVLLTDGILEAERGTEIFGRQRALDVVRQHLHEPAAQIVGKLHQAAREFSGKDGQTDDLTAVILKVI